MVVGRGILPATAGAPVRGGQLGDFLAWRGYRTDIALLLRSQRKGFLLLLMAALYQIEAGII